MKLAIPLLCLSATVLFLCDARSSESAPDCGAAVDILKAGIEIHPDQAAVLFEDALQTNPGCRRQLFLAAVESTGRDAEELVGLIRVARLEFPGDDNLFAEAAISVAPEHAAEIRDAFMSPPGDTSLALSAIDPAEEIRNRRLGEKNRLDEEVRDAIARMNARKEGKYWPEQELSEEPLQFRKTDEIRISKKFKSADESSLVGSLPLDGEDERDFPSGTVAIDDSRKPSDSLRLDESKFDTMRQATATAPLDATSRSLQPAGALPALPTSVYPIAPPADEGPQNDGQDPAPAPPLLIRPDPASPTSAKLPR